MGNPRHVLPCSSFQIWLLTVPLGTQLPSQGLKCLHLWNEHINPPFGTSQHWVESKASLCPLKVFQSQSSLLSWIPWTERLKIPDQGGAHFKGNKGFHLADWRNEKLLRREKDTEQTTNPKIWEIDRCLQGAVVYHSRAWWPGTASGTSTGVGKPELSLANYLATESKQLKIENSRAIHL